MPEIPPETPIDVPMQAPEPEPEPEPEPVTPPPVKFTTFYSTGSVSSGSSASAGAQLSSFAKQELKLGYTVPGDAAGGHSIELKGRFTLTVAESGSSLQGGSTASCAGAPAGSDTRVSIQWSGDTVSARVGGSRCGPVPVASQSGFAAWKFKVPSGSQLKGLWASAPEDSE